MLAVAHTHSAMNVDSKILIESLKYDTQAQTFGSCMCSSEGTGCWQAEGWRVGRTSEGKEVNRQQTHERPSFLVHTNGTGTWNEEGGRQTVSAGPSSGHLSQYSQRSAHRALHVS